jgi:hypothetical protein
MSATDGLRSETVDVGIMAFDTNVRTDPQGLSATSERVTSASPVLSRRQQLHLGKTTASIGSMKMLPHRYVLSRVGFGFRCEH